MRRSFRPVLALIMGALLLVGSVGGVQGQSQAVNPIAFVQDDGQSRNIFLINPDGTGIRRLTTGSANEENAQPVWSPDRSKIAFVSNRENNEFEIYVMDANGSNQRRVTPGEQGFDHSPAWSPDGTRLVYVADRNSGNNLKMIDLDGRNLRTLTAEAGEYARPAWSPDGTTIAFVAFGLFTQEIRLMDNDGSDERVFISSEESDFDLPAWSPDGTQLAYVSIVYSDSGTPISELYTRVFETGSDQLITRIENKLITALSWSEDGTELAFSLSSPDSRGRQISVINVAGENLRQVTSSAIEAYDPSWATPRAQGRINYGEIKLVEQGCPGALPIRLEVGRRGRVTATSTSNRLRSDPNTTASVVGTLNAGVRFEVLAGPECAEGYTWWQVRAVQSGDVGWTAEGAPNEYWLEPLVANNYLTDPPAGMVLLNNGVGLTTRRSMNNGEFQVEGYCGSQGYRTTRDNNNWYCLNRNGSRALTLGQIDYDLICRQTYNNAEATAVFNGDGRIPAFRWRCYGPPSGSDLADFTLPDLSKDENLMRPGQLCGGRTTRFSPGNAAVVDFNRGGGLRVLIDYAESSLRASTVALDNQRLTLEDGPICWGDLIYWYATVPTNTGTYRGWVAETDNTGNPFLCPPLQPECRS